MEGFKKLQRTLKFEGKDLGQRVDLLLIFERPQQGLLSIAWKVIQLQGISSAEGVAVWNPSTTAFFVPSAHIGNIITATDYSSCAPGQKCNVINDGDLPAVTAAVPGEPELLECENLTNSSVDIGIGYTDEDGTNLQPVLLWRDVSPSSAVVAQPPRKLEIYAIKDYKPTDTFQGEVDAPLLWSGNLPDLKEETIFKVSVSHGEVSLAPK